MSSHLQLVYEGKSKSGLTKQWLVVSVVGSHILGRVRWSGQWRKYCFFPEASTQFDASCLLEITTLLTMETKDHGKV